MLVLRFAICEPIVSKRYLKSKLAPAVVIHGGPGAPHNYVLGIVHLIAMSGRPVIVYDQIGCGQSTHLSDKPSEFWTVDLFKEELNLLLKELKISKKYGLVRKILFLNHEKSN